ncbi:hypothetical protein DdX_00655 [Ditylenchus destructor]|uniref:Uncharacterized protein n=1 Tax=Ditylenchus destructor TaxID=166010 RepID=A0AAD4NKE5_9BILA|nr:hypothetical protein DdX_00655 [Ditylenchus destructor]
MHSVPLMKKAYAIRYLDSWHVAFIFGNLIEGSWEKLEFYKPSALDLIKKFLCTVSESYTRYDGKGNSKKAW